MDDIQYHGMEENHKKCGYYLHSGGGFPPQYSISFDRTDGIPPQYW